MQWSVSKMVLTLQRRHREPDGEAERGSERHDAMASSGQLHRRTLND